MNRYPGVKAFIYDDIPLFHNVRFESNPGAPPVLYFLNANDEEVEKVELGDFTRERCNEILVSKGFYKKKSNDDQVPPEYENGPYVGHGEL